MSSSDLQFFFTMRDQIKLYHWHTHSYARHKATDETIDALDKTVDEYVETYMGKYGRSRLTGTTNTVKLMNLSEKSIVKFIKDCITYLQGPLVKRLDKEKDTDLLNLRDEMQGDLNKILYLFTLH